jgi:hypothetical protein
VEEQHTLRTQKYRYEPKDALVREHVRPQIQGAPSPAVRERQLQPQRKDAGRDMREREPQSGGSGKDARERDQPPRSVKPPAQKSETAVQKQRSQPPVAAPPREQQAPKSQGKDGGPQGKGAHRDPGGEPMRGRDKEPEKAHDKGAE